MARVTYKRAVVANDVLLQIVEDVKSGKKTIQQGAAESGFPVESFKDLYKDVKSELEKKGSEYASDVQKIASYKGVVRQMLLNVKDKKTSGRYPLRVVNVYIQPKNERLYEEKAYSVSKDAIRKGIHENFFYPDKALWHENEESGSSKRVRVPAERRRALTRTRMKRHKRMKKSLKRCVCKKKK
jgi:hypothetical protein